MQVTLIDRMGTDLSVVNSARVSFHKESEWNWFDEDGWEHEGLNPQDQKLIIYLAKHNHWTPFSHVQITLREKVPIFVARQRFKHMVGFTYNEVSRRYVDDTPEFFFPDVWRGRPVGAKQGSSDEVVEWLCGDGETQIRGLPEWVKGEGRVSKIYLKFIKIAEELYKEMIESGIAPEQARMVLPQSMYTEYYVTGSLAAYARAYGLRSDSHSQQEIQHLAKLWNDVIGSIEELKYSWKALTCVS